jgi:tRNA(His) 5'-end guanylyltransferase
MKDTLGRRMKRYYEDALRVTLPRHTYVILRVDGRAFHTYTARLDRPYCRPLADALDGAAIALCREVMGCRFAYGQSDEYSFLLTDFDREQSEMWFDGNLQKMVSVGASLFTAAFNQAFADPRAASYAVFDARVLVIPRREEVFKYFVWRQLDASANSLNMLASAHYSHEELHGVSESAKHELLHAKSLNWANEPTDFKRGRGIWRDPEQGWIVDREIPVFHREPGYLELLVP